MIDFELLTDTSSIAKAQRGDFSLLIKRLRAGSTLKPEERDFLADRLEGKPLRKGPKPNGTIDKDRLAFEAVYWLTRIEDIGEDSAQFEVSKAMDETDRNIRNRLARVRKKGGVWLAMLETKLEYMAEEMSKEELLSHRPLQLRKIKHGF